MNKPVWLHHSICNEPPKIQWHKVQYTIEQAERYSKKKKKKKKNSSESSSKVREHSQKVEYRDEYNKEHAIVTCAAWNQFMTTIVSTKPTEYPRNALLKYWPCFPLDTSNRKANATKIPKGKINTKPCVSL